MFKKSKKADCPFWRGPCREHECRLYIQVIGDNPNKGGHVDMWGCTFEMIPLLLIENSQQQRQTAAAVETHRNENATVNGVAISALQSLIKVAQGIPNDIRNTERIEQAGLQQATPA